MTLEEMIDTILARKLDELGLTEKLEKLVAFYDATEAAFRLIESDPHQWSARPCPTCQVVGNLIGRPFGCAAKAGT